ncbi:MAG: hypothetical protein EOO27_02290 [Comamonadaceae bacterium]|nr:MAG: hypothetical protein EOO27_02290 [Comamonadaceae bacterium]
MSKTTYKKNGWVMRTVHYRYMLQGEWVDSHHVCYEKTDDEAVASCYKTAIAAKLKSFHITEIVTKEW